MKPPGMTTTTCKELTLWEPGHFKKWLFFSLPLYIFFLIPPAPPPSTQGRSSPVWQFLCLNVLAFSLLAKVAAPESDGGCWRTLCKEKLHKKQHCGSLGAIGRETKVTWYKNISYSFGVWVISLFLRGGF